MTKNTQTQNTNSESHAAQRIVGVVFGIAEIILAFRLIFKLLGANPANGFVHGLYAVTQFFVGIFEGIFARVTAGGTQAIAVFEPATLIAIVLVALLAWFILKLMVPRSATHVEKTEQIEQANPPINK